MKNEYYQEVKWSAVRDGVIKVNPELARAIDTLDPPEHFTLAKVRYPFGQKILDQGQFILPDKNGLYRPLSDKTMRPLQKLFDYAHTIPMGIVMKNKCELYLKFNERILPFSTMKPGKIAALWNVLDLQQSAHTGKIWNITAGARSILFLSKISNNTKFIKLKNAFQLKCSKPNHLYDQWNILKEIADNPQFPEPWEVEILFFSKVWLTEQKSEKWKLFHHFLVDQAWKNTAFTRNQTVLNIVVSECLATKNLKPSPYLIDTVKHLLGIIQSFYPAFQLADENESAGPIKTWQTIFKDIYEIDYSPLMLHMGYEQYSRFYSLNYPTQLSFLPKAKNASSHHHDLAELQHIMDKFIDFIKEDSLNLSHTPLYRKTVQSEFIYYHNSSEQNHFQQPGSLLKTDSAFIKQYNKFSTLPFCESSPFFRGCIKINNKEPK